MNEPPKERRFGGRQRDLLGLAISLVCLVAVVWWASRQEPPHFPTSAEALLTLAGAVLLYGLPTLVRGLRWHEVLRLAGIVHRRLDAYALVVVGYMGNTVLPARGGEVLRAVIMGPRSNARRREILGTIVAERVLDLVVLVGLFSLMTWANVGGSPLGQEPAFISIAVATVLVFAIGVYLRLRRRGRFERFAAVVRPFVRSSKLLLGGTGFALLGLTALIWCLEGAVLMLVGQSLDLSVSLLDGVFLVVLASFTTIVPAAPGYVGTFDGALIFGLKALDVSGGDAVTFALLARFTVFVPITVAGLLLAFTRYGGFRVLKEYSAPAPAEG